MSSYLVLLSGLIRRRNIFIYCSPTLLPQEFFKNSFKLVRMRPPRCAICKRNHRNSELEFKLVRFKLTEEEQKAKVAQKARGHVGHPPGVEWFCEEHYKKAKSLKHLSKTEAIAKMRAKSSPFKPNGIKIVLALLFLLGLCTTSLFCQSPQSEDNPSRSRLMWDKINQALMERNLTLAEARMDTMLAWSKADGDTEQFGYAAQAKGQMYFRRAEYDSSLTLVRAAKKVFETTNPQQALLSNNVLSHIHRQMGNQDSMFHYLEIARQGLKSLNDSTAYVMTYNDLGLGYYYAGVLDSSAIYFNKQINYIPPTDSLKLYGTYRNLLKVYQKLNDFDNSLIFVEKALDITNSPTFPGSHAEAMSGKASVLISMDSFAQAEKWALAAVVLNDSIGSKRNAVSRYITLASAYLKNEKPDSANLILQKIKNPEAERNLEIKTTYYFMALELAIAEGDIEKASQLISVCNELIPDLGQRDRTYLYQFLKAEYYELLGKHKKAYDELKSYIQTHDSIVSKRNQIIASNLRVKYNTAQKEKKILDQELALKEITFRNKQLMLGLGALLSFGLLFYWFFRRNAAIQAALNQSEINRLQKENKLVAMQSLLSGQEEERKRIAQDLHDSIGSLMASIKMKLLEIQKSIEDVQKINITGEVDKMINQASMEVRRISHNMTPVVMELTGLVGAIEDLEHQTKAAGIQTDFKIDALEKIEDQAKTVMIYRILQEFIQNVIKHSEANHCSLIAKIENKHLLLQLSDDGKGIPVSVWEDSVGLGFKNIRSRVEFLEGTIHMESYNGTQFNLSIPL